MKKLAVLSLAALALAAACDKNPTDLGHVELPGARFHLANPGDPNEHTELKPTLTAATAALQGTTLANGTAVTIAWTAPTDPLPAPGQRTYFRYTLDCTGPGCTSIGETDVPTSTLSFTTPNLPQGIYHAKVRGLGGATATSKEHGSVWVTVSFRVGAGSSQPVDQTVIFGPAPSGVTYGDDHVDISSWASASSPITYSSESPAVCAVSGVEVVILAAGTCVIRADAEANEFYNAATATSSFEIARKSITGSFTAADKIYDGTRDATITGRSLSSVVPGDDVSLSGGSAEFDDKNAGTGKTVTGTGFSLSGTAADNYTLASSTLTTTADIAPKSVSASVTANDKNWDGNNSATISSCTVDGMIAGDDLSCSAASATFASANAGTWQVTATGISLAGEDALNYELSSTTATTTARILSWWTTEGFFSPVNMAVTWNTAKGGSTIPLKFRFFAGDTERTMVSDIASFVAAKITCDTGGDEDPIDFVTTGSTSLRYDATDRQFIQNWKTPSGAGCYKVTVTAVDGTTISAQFKMSR